MYKITTPTGETMTTEKPNFIRKHTNGCYVLCDRKIAEGIAYGGTPYMFADGANVYEVDGGREVDSLAQQNIAQAEHLAEADEIAIEFYETTLALKTINAEQDEAIIDIYEMMEGTING